MSYPTRGGGVSEKFQARTFLGRCLYDVGNRYFVPATEESKIIQEQGEEEDNKDKEDDESEGEEDQEDKEGEESEEEEVFSLPEGYLSMGSLCMGSSHGWIGLFNPENFKLCLMNPLTHETIPLPPLESFPEFIGPCPRKSYVSGKCTTITVFKCLDGYNMRNECIFTPKKVFGRFFDKIVLSSPPSDPDCAR